MTNEWLSVSPNQPVAAIPTKIAADYGSYTKANEMIRELQNHSISRIASRREN